MNPNPNQALWEKGDFTRIAASMRESGEAVVAGLGITPGLKVLDLGCGDGTTALPAARLGADVLGVDIARNLVEAGNQRAQAEGLTNCRFQQGDATNLSELADRQLRPRRQHLRRDVRAQAVRRRQGDGARHPARRPDRDGQLDPERSDARRADSEDQLCLFAAAARGLRQPDDLGDRKPTSSSDLRPRAFRARRSRSSRTRTPSTAPVHAGRVRGGLPKLLRADDERVRRRGTERQIRGTAAGARDALRAPEHQHGQRRARRFRRRSCA